MKTPAQINVEVLIGHGIRVIDRGDLLPGIKRFGKFSGRVAHDDHAFTGVIAGAPVKVILMAA
jgi:hypothetical protein